jgi:hypothetical protein
LNQAHFSSLRARRINTAFSFAVKPSLERLTEPSSGFEVVRVLASPSAGRTGRSNIAPSTSATRARVAAGPGVGERSAMVAIKGEPESCEPLERTLGDVDSVGLEACERVGAGAG